MELHTLQRDIQGLQATCIAIRSEKDELKQKEIKARLREKLIYLANQI